MLQTKNVTKHEPPRGYAQKERFAQTREKSIYETIPEDFSEAEITHFKKQLPDIFWKELLV